MKEDKYAPIKINLQKIKEGLSENQMKKIMYECDLLMVSPNDLIYIAGHLFNEGITASNTYIILGSSVPVTDYKIEADYSSYDNDEYSSHDDYSYYTP